MAMYQIQFILYVLYACKSYHTHKIWKLKTEGCFYPQKIFQTKNPIIHTQGINKWYNNPVFNAL